MSLSIVMPVYNALGSLKITLDSLMKNTTQLDELVLVDDHSDEETRKYIDELFSNQFRIIKTRNPQHSWTNASWNIGVSLTHSSYIAVVNSDITFSLGWDQYLIETLEDCSIACPWEQAPYGLVDLDPVIKKVHPGMIKGACFMFSRRDIDLFPLDSRLIHWCSDNLLADKASKPEYGGVVFDKRVVITHGSGHSGKTISPEELNKICVQDLLSYQEIYGRDMSLILNKMPPDIIKAVKNDLARCTSGKKGKK